MMIMPIGDYDFSNRIFFAKETGIIAPAEAEEWARKLEKAAQSSARPIVALVDAVDVTSVTRRASDIFAKASHTDNLLAVVVATNHIVHLEATTIGFLGKRGYTRVFNNLDDARRHADEILQRYS
jgi:hypothetical protein